MSFNSAAFFNIDHPCNCAGTLGVNVERRGY